MRAARRVLVVGALLAAAGASVAVAFAQGAPTLATAGPPSGTAAEQTHPAVLPHTGHALTRFTARLTLADAPGHSGVLATDYRLALSIARKHFARRCLPPAPSNIDSGSAGQVVRIRLDAPAGGWCTGHYTLTVFLQRGPYCPKPAAGQPPTPCPEFATRELDVGQANFVVTY